MTITREIKMEKDFLKFKSAAFYYWVDRQGLRCSFMLEGDSPNELTPCSHLPIPCL